MIRFVQPTAFDGQYPNWAGFTFGNFDAGSNAFHPGDDYNLGAGNADLGDPIFAVADGRVVYTQKSTVGYGYMTIIEHETDEETRALIAHLYPDFAFSGALKLCSLYGHQSEINVVVGQLVKAGQTIGKVGKSGNAPWAHLHFELYNPNGELLTKPWDYYPINQPLAWVKKQYLPAYLFIEATRAQVSVPNADEYIKIASDAATTLLNALTTAKQVNDPRYREKIVSIKSKVDQIVGLL